MSSVTKSIARCSSDLVKPEIKVAAEPEPYAASSSTAPRLRRGVSPTVQQSCFRFEPAFRGGGTAADPNDWTQREQAEQPNAGLEHPGRLPFQLHPDRKRSRNLLIAIELQRSSGRVAPFRLAKIDFDVITDIAAKREIDGKSRVPRAHVDRRSSEDQPHDPEFRAARRHA